MRNMRNLLIAISMLIASTAFAGEVTVPLPEYEKKKAELQALMEAQAAAARGAGVVVGETIYTGKSDGRNLHLQLRLHAQLGAARVFKTVPVIGVDAIVLSAAARGSSIALVQQNGQWVWHTDASGAVELTVDFAVPPRGPRGSIEYAFGTIQSPVTQLVGFFPYEGLSPRVNGAVTSKVTAVNGGTQLEAVLQPTSEIHIVGFHEVKSDDESRPAKIYGETQNLVSLSEDGIELFSVAQFTILYAPEKRFRIELPAGYDIVSADGQGAFRYRVETIDHQPVLIGETAFGMHDRYEISLRLKRALAPTDTRVLLPVPKLLDVERDTGFVAIEIPGKLSVEKVEGDGLVGIDVRELPGAIVDNSVSPVVRAFRYADQRSPVWVQVARYPEATMAAGGIDQLRATTVVTSDGRAMTEARFTIRNNLQQYLAVALAEGAEVKSAAIDGEPIKPSRDKNGRVLVPLVRSKNGGRDLIPFRVQIVYEERISSLGAAGKSDLALPRLEVPIASLSWHVFAPGGYETSALSTDHAPQLFVKNASWNRAGDFYGSDRSDDGEEAEDPYEGMAQGVDNNDISDEHRAALRAGRASGAVPVRVSVPEAGKELSIQSYWVEADHPVEARFWYARTPVVLLVKLLATLAMAVCGFLAARSLWARRWPQAIGVTVAAVVLPLAGASIGWAILLAVAALLLGNGRMKRAVAGGKTLLLANAEAMVRRLIVAKDAALEGMRTRTGFTLLRFAWFALRLFLLCLLGSWLIERTLSLLSLLGRPL